MTRTGGARIDFVSGEPVDGNLLAELIASGSVPREEALRYATAIGRALHQAHTRQLVHGSLSPFSVVIGPDSISILDPSCPGVREGTAAYRAPEQVRGETPDWRSDIFSFGAILYGLVYGRRAFAGEGAQLEQAILKCAPIVEESVPPGLQRVITGCLQKDPGNRRQRVQNAVIELKLAAAGHAGKRTAGQSAAIARALHKPPPVAAPVNPKALPSHVPARTRAIHPAYVRYLPQPLWLAAIGLFLLAATVVGAAMLFAPKRESPAAYEFAVAQPDDAKYPGMPAISPDARLVTWCANGRDGKRTLWLRALDETHSYRLESTDGAFAPFWSPDGQYIAYFASQSLLKIRVNRNGAAGSAQILCGVEGLPGGGSWSKNGAILFSSGSGGLYRIGAGGGQTQLATQVNAPRGERAHLWPQFLPDGEHFIFFVLAARSDRTGIYAGSLNSPGYSELISSETNAVYAAGARRPAKDGHLLFLRNRRLIGQPFDAAHLKMHDGAIELGVIAGPADSLSLAQVSVSDKGILVYQSVERPARELVWVDRAGKRLGAAGEPGDWGPPRISPDGKRIVAGRRISAGKNPDLWILEADGCAVQITNSEAGEVSPVWSPDGSKIVLASHQPGGFDLWLKTATAGGNAELLSRPGSYRHPDDWSRDGRYVLYTELSPETKSGIFALDMAGRKRMTILDTIHAEGYAALTRDQKWLAYQSDEEGVSEVYVQPFENASAGTKRLWKISVNGGGLPRWRADGSELFYMTSDGRVMAAAVHARGNDFLFDAPLQLFQTRSAKEWNLYDVSPDGQRFLVNVPMEWTGASPITVTTSWIRSLGN